MRYKYIDLREYPTIGEVIFPEEPSTVYVNRYALPRFRTFRVMYEEEPDNGWNNGNNSRINGDSSPHKPLQQGNILQFPSASPPPRGDAQSRKGGKKGKHTVKSKKESQENKQSPTYDERVYMLGEIRMYIITRIAQALEGVSASFVADLLFLDAEELLDLWEMLLRIEKTMPASSTEERVQMLRDTQSAMKWFSLCESKRISRLEKEREEKENP